MRTFIPNKNRLGERLFLVGVPVALVALAAGMLRVFNPATTWFFPPCPFRALTGFLCPGCGTLRALHELLNGNVGAAFKLNPLMMLLLPYVGYSGASSALEAVFGKALPRVFIRPAYIWILLAVILLYWILRNTPIAAMS
ncbi:MAG: DUF2752 domain-containing protein [Terriglobia bacterium]